MAAAAPSTMGAPGPANAVQAAAGGSSAAAKADVVLQQLNLPSLRTRSLDLQNAIGRIMQSVHTNPSLKWSDVLGQFAMVNVELLNLVEDVKPILKIYVAYPKTVNAENAPILPIMLSSKMLPEMEAEEACTKEQVLLGVSNLSIQAQTEKLQRQIDMVRAACELAEKVLQESRKAYGFGSRQSLATLATVDKVQAARIAEQEKALRLAANYGDGLRLPSDQQQAPSVLPHHLSSALAGGDSATKAISSIMPSTGATRQPVQQTAASVLLLNRSKAETMLGSQSVLGTAAATQVQYTNSPRSNANFNAPSPQQQQQMQQQVHQQQQVPQQSQQQQVQQQQPQSQQQQQQQQQQHQQQHHHHHHQQQQQQQQLQQQHQQQQLQQQQHQQAQQQQQQQHQPAHNLQQMMQRQKLIQAQKLQLQQQQLRRPVTLPIQANQSYGGHSILQQQPQQFQQLQQSSMQLQQQQQLQQLQLQQQIQHQQMQNQPLQQAMGQNQLAQSQVRQQMGQIGSASNILYGNTQAGLMGSNMLGGLTQQLPNNQLLQQRLQYGGTGISGVQSQRNMLTDTSFASMSGASQTGSNMGLPLQQTLQQPLQQYGQGHGQNLGQNLGQNMGQPLSQPNYAGLYNSMPLGQQRQQPPPQ